MMAKINGVDTGIGHQPLILIGPPTTSSLREHLSMHGNGKIHTIAKMIQGYP